MKSPYTPIPTNGAPSLFYKNITYFYQISYLYGDFIMVHFNCSQYSKKINGLFSFMQDILIFSRKKVEHIMVFGFFSHLDMTELIRENSVDNHKQISFMEYQQVYAQQSHFRNGSFLMIKMTGRLHIAHFIPIFILNLVI